MMDAHDGRKGGAGKGGGGRHRLSDPGKGRLSALPAKRSKRSGDVDHGLEFLTWKLRFSRPKPRKIGVEPGFSAGRAGMGSRRWRTRRVDPGMPPGMDWAEGGGRYGIDMPERRVKSAECERWIPRRWWLLFYPLILTGHCMIRRANRLCRVAFSRGSGGCGRSMRWFGGSIRVVRCRR